MPSKEKSLVATEATKIPEAKKSDNKPKKPVKATTSKNPAKKTTSKEAK